MTKEQSTIPSDAQAASKPSVLWPEPGTRLLTLLIFCVSLFVLGMISYVINEYAVDAARERLRESLRIGEERRVDAMAQQVQETLLNITSDVLVVEGLITRNLAADFDLDTLGSVMVEFADNHKIYDQLRFIDRGGKEVIRVNNLDDGAVLLDETLLQDKSSSDYVLAARNIKRDTVLVTAIDVNREFGKVETPIKLVMRFLSPVFDQRGERAGTAVVNFKVASILNNLLTLGRTTLSHPIVLGPEGVQPLAEYSSNDSAALTLVGSKQRNFSLEYPEAWRKMQEAASGFLEDSFGGTITYSTVAPSLLDTKGRFLRPVIWAMPLDITESQPRTWYFVSHVHSSDLEKFLSIAQVRSPETEVLFGAILVLLAWILALRIVGMREAAARLRRVSTLDYLTGLINRAEFEKRLHIAVSHAQRFNRPMAVLFLDLDGFKQVNDSMGHAAGDELLKEVATKLRKSLRESDVVARLGGDEFAVILSETRSPADTDTVIGFIKTKLSKPFQLKGSEAQIGASIGSATYPDDAADADALLDAADQSMYAEKAR